MKSTKKNKNNRDINNEILEDSASILDTRAETPNEKTTGAYGSVNVENLECEFNRPSYCIRIPIENSLLEVARYWFISSVITTLDGASRERKRWMRAQIPLILLQAQISVVVVAERTLGAGNFSAQ